MSATLSIPPLTDEMRDGTACFQGAWWVWLRRERRAKSEEFVASPMNLQDVEYTFVNLRTTGDIMWKPYFNKGTVNSPFIFASNDSFWLLPYM